MRNFIDKYRVLIGIILILIILASGLILVFEKNKLNLYKSPQTATSKNNDELIKRINDLEERIKKLEESPKAEVAGASTEANIEVSDKININTADQKTLESLPGIGEKRAADIISYREANGGFKNISEIKNIKGIGDSIYGQIKDSITVGD